MLLSITQTPTNNHNTTHLFHTKIRLQLQLHAEHGSLYIKKKSKKNCIKKKKRSKVCKQQCLSHLFVAVHVLQPADVAAEKLRLHRLQLVDGDEDFHRAGQDLGHQVQRSTLQRRRLLPRERVQGDLTWRVGSMRSRRRWRRGTWRRRAGGEGEEEVWYG